MSNHSRSCCYCSIGDEHPDPHTSCWPTQETPMTPQPTDWTDEELAATLDWTPHGLTDQEVNDIVRATTRATNERLDTLTREQLRETGYETVAALVRVLDEWLLTQHGITSSSHGAGHFLNLLHARGYHLAYDDED